MAPGTGSNITVQTQHREHVTVWDLAPLQVNTQRGIPFKIFYLRNEYQCTVFSAVKTTIFNRDVNAASTPTVQGRHMFEAGGFRGDILCCTVMFLSSLGLCGFVRGGVNST